MKAKLGFSLKEICVIIIITAITTSLTTGIIIYNNNKLNNGTINLNKDESLKEFLKVYASLNEDYYGDIDKTKMIDSAISGMLNYLGEDYSTYMNKEETNELAEELSGKYQGIGITVIDNNRVFKVHDNTPAKEAGIKENDIITKVNGVEVDNENVANIISKDSENTLLIQRGDETLEIKVTPKQINTPLTREIKEYNGKKIGYIYIPSFNNTVAEEFRKALEELESKEITALTIDLRWNTGGLLTGATEIAAMFLEKDKTIYSLEEKNSSHTYKDDTKEKRDYKVAILINDGTASASEILAAALKDSYGAILIGSPSFGKGKVQQAKYLEDGSMVKYTTARWYTPNGECIDGMGLFPDYSVTLEENNNDNQLEKALELLQ